MLLKSYYTNEQLLCFEFVDSNTSYFRLLGAIPGPILYGRLIDEACLLSSGNCLFYDNYSMSVYLTAVSIAAKGCSVSFYIIAVFSSRWCAIPEIKDSVDQKTTRTQARRRFSSAGRLIR